VAVIEKINGRRDWNDRPLASFRGSAQGRGKADGGKPRVLVRQADGVVGLGKL